MPLPGRPVERGARRYGGGGARRWPATGSFRLCPGAGDSRPIMKRDGALLLNVRRQDGLAGLTSTCVYIGLPDFDVAMGSPLRELSCGRMPSAAMAGGAVPVVANGLVYARTDSGPTMGRSSTRGRGLAGNLLRRDMPAIVRTSGFPPGRPCTAIPASRRPCPVELRGGRKRWCPLRSWSQMLSSSVSSSATCTGLGRTYRSLVWTMNVGTGILPDRLDYLLPASRHGRWGWGNVLLSGRQHPGSLPVAPNPCQGDRRERGKEPRSDLQQSWSRHAVLPSHPRSPRYDLRP